MDEVVAIESIVSNDQDGSVSFKQQSCYSRMTEQGDAMGLASAHIVVGTRGAWSEGSLSVQPPSRLAFQILIHSWK